MQHSATDLLCDLAPVTNTPCEPFLYYMTRLEKHWRGLASMCYGGMMRLLSRLLSEMINRSTTTRAEYCHNTSITVHTYLKALARSAKVGWQRLSVLLLGTPWIILFVHGPSPFGVPGHSMKEIALLGKGYARTITHVDIVVERIDLTWQISTCCRWRRIGNRQMFVYIGT